MKYVDEFRNIQIAKKILKDISRNLGMVEYRVTEVCGTHIQAIPND